MVCQNDLQTLILSPKAAFLSAILGLLIGGIWEIVGTTFLWTLADPKLILFVAALVAWPIFGLIMASVLRITEITAPRYKNIVKLITAPTALVTAKITSATEILTFRMIGPNVFGAPIYMVIGMTVLIYVIDYLRIQ